MFLRLIQLSPSHTLAATDSTGVSALVISNVATRVVVEVVVDKWFNCVDFIDGL